MENVYKVRLMLHLKSLRSPIIFVSLVMLVTFYISHYKGKYDFNSYALGVLPIVLITFAPTLYLHITYYLKNTGLTVKVDKGQDILTIHRSGHEQIHRFSNIVSVDQHMGIYYKDYDHQRRMPWTSYGFLIIKLDNGEQLCLTSLMLDIQNSPFKIAHTYFKFFPYLTPGMEIHEKRMILNETFDNEVSYYKFNFKEHSDEQLKEKIVNQKNTCQGRS